MGRTLQGGFLSGVTNLGAEAYEERAFSIVGHGPISFRPHDDVFTHSEGNALDPYGWWTDWDYQTEGHTLDFACTASALYAVVYDNPRITSSTFAIRKNGVVTDCTLVVARGETGILRGTGSATFESGDVIDAVLTLVQQDHGDIDYVSTDFYVGSIYFEMDDGDDTTTHGCHRASVENGNIESVVANYEGDGRIANNSGINPAQVTGRDYWAYPIAGVLPHPSRELQYDTVDATYLAFVTNEATIRAQCSTKARAAGTLTSGEIHVIYNDDGGQDAVPSIPIAELRTQNVGMNNGGTDGAPTWSLTNVHDTTIGIIASTGTRSVASGDVLVYGFPAWTALSTYTGTPLVLTSGHLYFNRISSNFAGTSLKTDVLLTVDTQNGYTNDVGRLKAAIADGIYYSPILGHLDYQDLMQVDAETDTTLEYIESVIGVSPPFCMEISYLRAYVSSYAAGAVSVAFMKNGVAQSVGVAVNAANWTEDSTHTFSAGPNDVVYLRWTFTNSWSGLMDSLAWTQEPSDDCPETAGGSECDCDTECPGSESFCSLKEHALKMLGESVTSPAYWSADEIGRYVNDAYIEICRETKALEYIEAIKLSADDEGGTLSRFVGQVFRATFDDRKIQNVTKWELDRTEPNWEALSGYVTNYVTTLHDDRAISTFKAWDGTEINAEQHFYNDGAYTYAAWANGQSYAIGIRRTLVGSDGKTRAYACILAHTSATATNKPASGSAWETYWVPLALMVWCVKNPALMEDCDEPELPPWSHLAIAFLAASKALTKRGEMRNLDVSQVYAAIAGDYVAMLKGLVAQRAPERVVAMGGRWANRVMRPQLPIVEES